MNQLLSFSLKKELAEIALATIYSNNCIGSEELDDRVGFIKIKAYFENIDDLEKTCTDLEPLQINNVEKDFIKDRDWNKEWRKSIKPVKISPNFWVKPSWSDFYPPSNEQIFIVDPKMSFGSGHHESTRICATLLEQTKLKKKKVLDIGTGTGILSMQISKLGGTDITAFDIDSVVLDNVLENFKKNSISNINFFVGTIDSIKINTQYDIIVVNMIKSRIFSVLSSINKILKKDGLLICSGLLVKEIEEVNKKFFKYNLIPKNTIDEGEWSGIVFKKES